VDQDIRRTNRGRNERHQVVKANAAGHIAHNACSVRADFSAHCIQCHATPCNTYNLRTSGGQNDRRAPSQSGTGARDASHLAV
jgi:hypothetical protein